MKRGWHDSAETLAHLQRRIKEFGLEGRGIETYFDNIDCDEGRDRLATKPWESI
jgi:hypothetical protein